MASDLGSSSLKLTTIRSLLKELDGLPYCTGTIPLNADNSLLFFKSGDTAAELVDFTQAKDAQLEQLFKACEAATFGLDHQDVLDESYRKAGKMDVNRFAMHFLPDRLGVVGVVSDFLLRGRTAQKTIYADLYSLNVYGPGGFFKPHVDTPRSSNMIGSLVVVLPTNHEGGSLIIRNAGKEWSFDSAQAVKDESTPHAAFIAFFSDVEHEVTTITAGYRVSLTYNLYLENASKTSTSVHVSIYDQIETQFKEALAALLTDPAIRRNASVLGFGLSHKYPFNPNTTKLKDIKECLKGTDAAILRACNSLSLTSEIKAVYRDESDDRAVLFDEFASIGTDTIDEGITNYLKEFPNSKEIYSPWDKPLLRRHFGDNKIPIAWVKPLQRVNSFRSPYVYYGNNASLDYLYGEVCLVVMVDGAKKSFQ